MLMEFQLEMCMKKFLKFEDKVKTLIVGMSHWLESNLNFFESFIWKLYFCN